MQKREPQQGDRCRLKGYGPRGEVLEGEKGRIQEVLSDAHTHNRKTLYKIKLDDDGYPIVFRSQIVLFKKPRKPREWFIVIGEIGQMTIYPDDPVARLRPADEVVHVREVLK